MSKCKLAPIFLLFVAPVSSAAQTIAAAIPEADKMNPIRVN